MNVGAYRTHNVRIISVVQSDPAAPTHGTPKLARRPAREPRRIALSQPTQRPSHRTGTR